MYSSPNGGFEMTSHTNKSALLKRRSINFDPVQELN
jgi:hypothetical protein